MQKGKTNGGVPDFFNFDPDTLCDNYQLDAKASRELLRLRLRLVVSVMSEPEPSCVAHYHINVTRQANMGQAASTSYYSRSAKIFYTLCKNICFWIHTPNKNEIYLNMYSTYLHS